ncbi:MAG: hypothetical protein WCE52_17255 [Candidatus Acidiferrum sp.]
MQTTANTGESKRRSRLAWSAIIASLVALAGFAVWHSARTAASMSGAASSEESQFAQAQVGSKVKVAMEVASANADGTLRGTLLQKKTEEKYARTSMEVVAHIADHTAYVMGKRDDVHGGSVIHITGVVQKDRSLDAEQIVILTGYVHLE